ncbi:MAG: dihydrodipicolinate synthase family protein [Candidatus Methylomirabilales bacterium]
MTEMQVGRHLAAVIAPFKTELSLDEHALRRLCQHVLKSDGIDGLVVNAHASEVDSMTMEERVWMVEIAGEEARAKNRKVVSGVVPFPGSNAGAVATAQAMEKAGADAVLLLGPAWFTWGVQMLPEVVEAYVRDVASAVSIPVLYFVAGDYTGIKYTPELVQRICSVDNVVGIKDTMWTPHGFDANLKAIRELHKPIDVLTGNDTYLYYNFLSGADGTLLVLHCLLGAPILEMFDAVKRGDTGRGLNIHRTYERLIDLLFQPPMIRMPSRMKYALSLIGVLPEATTRPPVPPPSHEEKEAIRTEMERLGLTGSQAAAAGG